MKITFITYIYPYPERGYNPGVERVVQEFARELVQQGHEVHVLTPYRNGGVKNHERDEGVQIHRVSDTRRYFGRVGSLFSIDMLSLNWSITSYSDLLHSSDIVHTFTPLIWKFFSTQMVAHYHHWDDPSNPIEYLYLPTSHYLWRRCYTLANKIVAVSEYSAEDLASRGVDRDKIEVVPNGVDTNKFSPGSSSLEYKEWDTAILYVGPLVERKGLKYLIKAMPDVLEHNPDTGLILVGGGDQDELENIALSLGIVDHIHFEGFVPEHDLPDYYRKADVFVFPSLLEGFGMVLVEAMASGLPIVSTTSSAIPEVVDDAGLLVEPRDSRALAQKVCLALENKNKWEQRSVQRVKKEFSWEKTTKKLLDVYDGILDNL